MSVLGLYGNIELEALFCVVLMVDGPVLQLLKLLLLIGELGSLDREGEVVQEPVFVRVLQSKLLLEPVLCEEVVADIGGVVLDAIVHISVNTPDSSFVGAV